MAFIRIGIDKLIIIIINIEHHSQLYTVINKWQNIVCNDNYREGHFYQHKKCHYHQQYYIDPY